MKIIWPTSHPAIFVFIIIKEEEDYHHHIITRYTAKSSCPLRTEHTVYIITTTLMKWTQKANFDILTLILSSFLPLIKSDQLNIKMMTDINYCYIEYNDRGHYPGDEGY